MLCTIYNINRHLKYCLQEINCITNDQYYQYIVDEQSKQLMDI